MLLNTIYFRTRLVERKNEIEKYTFFPFSGHTAGYYAYAARERCGENIEDRCGTDQVK